jgi:hypothetical protein
VTLSADFSEVLQLACDTSLPYPKTLSTSFTSYPEYTLLQRLLRAMPDDITGVIQAQNQTKSKYLRLLHFNYLLL